MLAVWSKSDIARGNPIPMQIPTTPACINIFGLGFAFTYPIRTGAKTILGIPAITLEIAVWEMACLAAKDDLPTETSSLYTAIPCCSSFCLINTRFAVPR
eukprot:NODE_593_length_6321_cov_0.361299.p5 type:complete len:100 gc:universal NODE_593_length_6321_cov_0.361299:1185-886(-)